MPINPGPVPSPLIPFFREGGIKIVMSVAEELGTGLRFINKFRTLYPKDPRATVEEYNGWLSYLNTVAKAGLQGGLEFRSLDPTSGIDPNLFPANYFLRSPTPSEDRYLFNVQYTSVNPETGQAREMSMGVWQEELGEKQGLIDRIGESVTEFLVNLSASLNKQFRYYMLAGSLIIKSIFRRF